MIIVPTRRGLRTRRRSLVLRRVRAVLAGGLVLGVGATMTLASWNDSEFATGTFTAGRFDVVGSVNGTNFASHATAGTAIAMVFAQAADAAALAPGKTVYALFSVKTVNPSVAGTVKLTASTYAAGTLADYLTYGVKTVTAAQCATAADYAAAGSVSVVADGSVLSTSAATSQTLTANGGNQVNYCFAITMPAATGNGAQGLPLTQTWQFAATSS
ncbi:SipW-dependent-type signal peptide-containing protein [Microbacterium panaciterrae]|uniref:SipW-cognate class signal peptide n=1 Tax=Microbacterium panaciterrae TaxID=985759 RepID=A0ABP8PHI9_9MICO